ncbi:MAG: hypothetical protein IJ189_11860 [Clostridia bacterium]|nr:hypothetical protein [Clostridia bacterium]
MMNRSAYGRAWRRPPFVPMMGPVLLGGWLLRPLLWLSLLRSHRRGGGLLTLLIILALIRPFFFY